MRETHRMSPDEKIPYRKMYDNGMRWQGVTSKINFNLGTTYTKTQVRDMLKRVSIQTDENQPTLVFSDTHFPYQREGYLEFLKNVHKRFNCSKDVICCGDLVDHHAISRFQSEPDAVGDITEFDQAFEEIQELISVFPNMVVTLGNHDLIVERQAKSLGISKRYLKSFSELWQLPVSVKVVEEYEKDGVLYSHGLGSSGKDGAINTAIKQQSSYIQGHTHAYAGVKWAASHKHLIFGMNVGCLCDPKSIAMAYGKVNLNRPTLGCGVVIDKYSALWIPFVLD